MSAFVARYDALVNELRTKVTEFAFRIPSEGKSPL